MKILLDLITAIINLAGAMLNLKNKNFLTSKNKIMTEKMTALIVLLIVCAIIVFGICYIFKTK